MKPAPFAYVRAASLDRGLDQGLYLLARPGGAARVLTDGQSLIASLNLRLPAPALPIDGNGLARGRARHAGTTTMADDDPFDLLHREVAR